MSPFISLLQLSELNEKKKKWKMHEMIFQLHRMTFTVSCLMCVKRKPFWTFGNEVTVFVSLKTVSVQSHV